MSLDSLPAELLDKIADYVVDESGGVFIDTNLLSLILTSKHFYHNFSDRIREHMPLVRYSHITIDEKASSNAVTFKTPCDLILALEEQPHIVRYIRRLDHTSPQRSHTRRLTATQAAVINKVLSKCPYLLKQCSHDPALQAQIQLHVFHEIVHDGEGLPTTLCLLPNLRVLQLTKICDAELEELSDLCNRMHNTDEDLDRQDSVTGGILNQLKTLHFYQTRSNMALAWESFSALPMVDTICVEGLDWSMVLSLDRWPPDLWLRGVTCIQMNACFCNSRDLGQLIEHCADLERLVCHSCFNDRGELSRSGRMMHQKLDGNSSFTQAMKREGLQWSIRRGSTGYGLIIGKRQDSS